MIESVRVAAQLGNPPEKFYTNASESMNNSGVRRYFTLGVLRL